MQEVFLLGAMLAALAGFFAWQRRERLKRCTVFRVRLWETLTPEQFTQIRLDLLHEMAYLCAYAEVGR